MENSNNNTKPANNENGYVDERMSYSTATEYKPGDPVVVMQNLSDLESSSSTDAKKKSFLKNKGMNTFMYYVALMLAAMNRSIMVIFAYTMCFMAFCGILFAQYMVRMDAGLPELVCQNMEDLYRNMNLFICALCIVVLFATSFIKWGENRWRRYSFIGCVVVFLYDVTVTTTFYWSLTSGRFGSPFAYFAEADGVFIITGLFILSLLFKNAPYAIADYCEMNRRDNL